MRRCSSDVRTYGCQSIGRLAWGLCDLCLQVVQPPSLDISRIPEEHFRFMEESLDYVRDRDARFPCTRTMTRTFRSRNSRLRRCGWMSLRETIPDHTGQAKPSSSVRHRRGRGPGPGTHQVYRRHCYGGGWLTAASAIDSSEVWQANKDVELHVDIKREDQAPPPP